MKVIIDSRSSFAYGAFYIEALEKKIGRNNICFSYSLFSQLEDPGLNLRFVIYNGNISKKYYIHTNDPYQIMDKDYEWCDVYGSVNANFTHFPKLKYPKLLSLCPSFGVSPYSFSRTMTLSIINLIKSWKCVLNRSEYTVQADQFIVNKWKNVKHFIGRYYRTYEHRLPIEVYTPSIAIDGFVFFLSTLWYNHVHNNNDAKVNLYRSWFIKACKDNPNCTFEGGLLPDVKSSTELFKNVLATNRLTLSEWVEKTKQSSIVFNTPAFWDCHGWKLGEYLSLGKCILSTPLVNDLPHPLEHGVNIHFVENNEQSIREGVEYLLRHPEYRQKLQNGARLYWDKYGSQLATLNLLGI